MAKRHRAAVGLWLILSAACGGQSAPNEGTTPGAGDVALGGFGVDLVPAMDGMAAYTDVFGRVFDGATPSPLEWRETEVDGDCRLSTPRVPFCSPGCGGSAACVADGVCKTYPTAQNLGRVEVRGVGPSTFTMDPASGSYRPGASIVLGGQPFTEGAAVEFVVPGSGAFAAFTLRSEGVSALELTGGNRLMPGEPIALTWNASKRAGATQIEIAVDLSHHGGTKGKLICTTADDGAFTIPAGMLSRLHALGVAGFPGLDVTRVARGTAKLSQGVVSLRVTSAVHRTLEIPGLQSCADDSACPAGKTCGDDLKCQ